MTLASRHIFALLKFVSQHVSSWVSTSRQPNRVESHLRTNHTLRVLWHQCKNTSRWITRKQPGSHILTPSLPQPVEFPGWKVHAYKPANSIVDNNCTFSTAHFDRNPFTCSCEGKGSGGGVGEKGGVAFMISDLALLLVVFSEWQRKG